MEKPDLHAIAVRTTALYDALGDLRAAVDEAYEAALGETDPETDEEITPPSGDYEGYFEKAKAKLLHAQTAVAEARELLATVQGFRDFTESGSVPV